MCTTHILRRPLLKSRVTRVYMEWSICSLAFLNRRHLLWTRYIPSMQPVIPERGLRWRLSVSPWLSKVYYIPCEFRMVCLCSRADNDLLFSDSRIIFCGVKGSLCLSILSHPHFINPLTYHMLFFAIYRYSTSTKIRIIFTGPYMWSMIVWKKAMYMHLVRLLKSATQFTRRLISGVEHPIEYVVKGTKDVGPWPAQPLGRRYGTLIMISILLSQWQQVVLK